MQRLRFAAVLAVVGPLTFAACSDDEGSNKGPESGGSPGTSGSAGKGGGSSGGASSGGSTAQAGRGGTNAGGTNAGGTSSDAGAAGTPGDAGSGGRGQGGDTGAAGQAGAPSGGGSGGSGSPSTPVCDDEMDNDGDGPIDSADPECTSRFDTDEGSFATGGPGDHPDATWNDCFFDGNIGSGDDGCRYKPACMTGDLPPTDPDCESTQECRDFCGIRTPNGCDCFGCCSVRYQDSLLDVWITATCSMNTLDDDVACPRCLKTQGCENPLSDCELALGMTADELPASCIGVECVGSTPCGSQAECNANEVCVNGCCVRDSLP